MADPEVFSYIGVIQVERERTWKLVLVFFLTLRIYRENLGEWKREWKLLFVFFLYCGLYGIVKGNGNGNYYLGFRVFLILGLHRDKRQKSVTTI